jgi:outer membrane protein W
MMRRTSTYRFVFILFVVFISAAHLSAQRLTTDTTMIFTPSNPNLMQVQNYKPATRAWGIDLLLSNNGFGLGAFYRYEMTDELALMFNFAISDVKDDGETELYDNYGNSIIPNKINRLLLLPLTVSIQYRLFKNDIVDNFRPYITAGIGPTMVFVAPYAHPTTYYSSDSSMSFIDPGKIDFFTSLKYGRPRYTLGGFIGVGAFFGMETGTITGLSIKYFLAPFPSGIEVMKNGYMKNFGGLFITLTFGGMF